VVFAENLCAINFPARQVLSQIQSFQVALESIKKSTQLAIEENPRVLDNDQPIPFETPERLEEILRGFKISYLVPPQPIVF
jgi:predicted RNase H-like HicB family nuclease